MNEASSADSSSSPASPFQVLIVEPDEWLGAEIVGALAEAVPGTTSAVAHSVSEAQQLALQQRPQLFVLDLDAAYDAAQEFIYDLRTSHPEARAIILTATHFTAHREQVAGLGAIHFLEKPFPRGDFMTLVEALLAPAGSAEGERFQGTLSDLHIADIIQLKCISGATSMLEFTGPRGEKARVYFQNGQVRHATAPGKEGREAFNEIVDWKGGKISEVAVPEGTPQTITLDWQVLLMEAVRHIDESRGAEAAPAAPTSVPKARTILVIDDSLMLLSFVKEILSDENYQVATAATAAEGLRACHKSAPELILLDYVLPDMKGDEVCRKLVADPVTSKIPVVYMSGFGSDLKADPAEFPNVIGSLSKPFTSESLINAVGKYLGESAADPKPASEAEFTSALPPPPPPPSSLGEDKAATVPDEEKPAKPPAMEPAPPPVIEEPAPPPVIEEPAPPPVAEEAPPPPEPPGTEEPPPIAEPIPMTTSTPDFTSTYAPPAPAPAELPNTGNAYFCGDSSFFSLHWALQTIAREKLTGTLRAFWNHASVELLAGKGRVLLVTTRDPNLYCEEAPVTLLNVDADRIAAARERQASEGCPIFLTLAKEGLILRDPALQLVQHYGQKLFARLWTTERVRFVFEVQDLPDYTGELPAPEENVDQWALSTLRFVQYQELGKGGAVEPSAIPAYTRDGYERVQQLRLTVAEAQFASQFNGSRSVAQISKNLRLDIKFARLTLFRFLALEIVECWPAQLAQKPDARGGFRGIFGR